ncbi:MAG: glycosyltransferase [Caldilineaceae bacterium]
MNYNTCGNLLRDCLESVQPQRHNLRMCVVVVDNASTDGSADMVRREFPNVHLIANTAKRVGYSAGNNVALRAYLASTGHPPKPLAQLAAVRAAA